MCRDRSHFEHTICPRCTGTLCHPRPDDTPTYREMCYAFQALHHRRTRAGAAERYVNRALNPEAL